ncbi:hypothetical protein GA0115253_104371, partial [Streptomyces sp. Termitarium-T10T-6]
MANVEYRRGGDDIPQQRGGEESAGAA